VRDGENQNDNKSVKRKLHNISLKKFDGVSIRKGISFKGDTLALNMHLLTLC
jgi:hypothetical protein